MFIVTPELVRAVHDDRRRRLIREAEVRRVHRENKAARRLAGSPGGLDGWFRARFGRHDAKVARLSESWLALDHRTARLLGRLADEVELPAGTVLAPGRFSYIGLDVAHLVVTTATPPVTLAMSARVLILTTVDLERIRDDVPALSSLRRGQVPVSEETDPIVAPGPCPSESRRPTVVADTSARDRRDARRRFRLVDDAPSTTAAPSAAAPVGPDDVMWDEGVAPEVVSISR